MAASWEVDVGRKVASVTLDTLDQLPSRCRGCVFWELAPHVREKVEANGHPEFEKEAWLSSVLLDWGSCGRIISVDQVPAGYAFFAPPSSVPMAAGFPTSPVSPDAVLLTALRVLPDFRGGGLGRVLIQTVAGDLTRRGVTAIEAFGDAGAPPSPEEGPRCVVPADFLRQVGFTTVRPHPKWPRLRLELRSAISWKEDVEAALERLLGSVTISTAEPSLRPA